MSKIKLNEDWKVDNGYKCPYCEKIYTKKGICTHIWRTHGDGITHDPNIGYKDDRIVWNKGLSKELDERVKQYSDSIKSTVTKKVEDGTFKPNTASEEYLKKLSEEQSKRNRGGRTKWFRFEKNGGQIVNLQGTWEVRFAKILESIDPDWVRPNKPLKWVDDDGNEKRYTPDFYSPKTNKYYEVKGYWWGDDKRKMELVLEQNSDLKIEMIFKDDLLRYEKLIG